MMANHEETYDDHGWIKLYRKSLFNGWLKNHNLWVFWCYCLLKASHRENRVIVGNRQIILQPGQFVFGRKKASKETRLSERSIRTCVYNLCTLGNLTIKTTNKFSLITIVNWELYQNKGIKTTSKMTSNRPATDHIQELKNKKKLRNKGIVSDENNSCPLSFIEYLKTNSSIEVISNYEDVVEAIKHFLYAYEKYRGGSHPKLKPEQWYEYIMAMSSFYDPDTGKDHGESSLDDLKVMIEQYFQKQYRDGCDYRLAHFVSPGVFKNLFFENIYNVDR
jgi:hypothetical protein